MVLFHICKFRIADVMVLFPKGDSFPRFCSPSGKLKDTLRSMLRPSANALAFDLAAEGIDGDDFASIMRDFALVRRHIWFLFSVKFAHWQQHPWLLFGVGHASEDVARRCAHLALGLFAAMPDGHNHHLGFIVHVLATWQMLNRDGGVRCWRRARGSADLDSDGRPISLQPIQ